MSQLVRCALFGAPLVIKKILMFSLQSSYAQQNSSSNWSSAASTKQAPPPSWGGQPHPQNEVSPPTTNQTTKPPFVMPDNEIDDFTFWDTCGREAKKNPAPGRSHGNPNGASGGGGGVQRRKGDKEEVRQLMCSYSLACTNNYT